MQQHADEFEMTIFATLRLMLNTKVEETLQKHTCAPESTDFRILCSFVQRMSLGQQFSSKIDYVET